MVGEISRPILRNRDDRESFTGPSHLTHMMRVKDEIDGQDHRLEACRSYWPCAATYAAIASMSSCVRFSTTASSAATRRLCVNPA